MEKMSRNKMAALKSIESICGKTMTWALVFSLMDFVLEGKCLTGDMWQVLILLAVVAGTGWWWALSHLSDE